MIVSGNTVGDLVSEEFAERLGLEGDDVQDHIAVPTAATATTVLVIKRCWKIAARLAGIEREFTIRPLVVRGLIYPVNLGQHFLGRHWCSLDFAAGCTQLGVWGQSLQLVGRMAGRPPWAKEGRQPGEVEESSPPVGRASGCKPLPRTTGLGAPRAWGYQGGEGSCAR